MTNVLLKEAKKRICTILQRHVVNLAFFNKFYENCYLAVPTGKLPGKHCKIAVYHDQRVIKEGTTNSAFAKLCKTFVLASK